MAQGVSEYVRGFSFMPENNVEVIDLQYIEGGELSRAWKISRREKLKNIEAKIWDEFINERDVVESVKSDDPYQFLEQLPEDCIREVLDTELAKMKAEMTEEVPVEQANEQKQEYNEDLQDARETMVTFAEALEDEHCDIITILDDEDGSDGAEGGEGEREELNESIESPCTVREKTSSPELTPKVPEKVTDRDKSPENVTSMIETSIYSAKVKELQSKVNLELQGVIMTLENHNVHQLDPNLVPKLQRQCSEFCARFGRINVYPITRQINDVTRHNNTATPYARHTHTRSQLIRAVSLQQNMLQSLQMLHKWLSQKTPLRECVLALKNFIQQVREADSVCPAEVHNEELLDTCESLDKTVGLYLVRLNTFLGHENDTNASVSRSGKSSKSSNKKSFGSFNKQDKSQPAANAKLSMYSLDRFPRSSKASFGKSSGGTSKARLGGASTVNVKNDNPLGNKTTSGNHKNSKSRRPLMRAPGGGKRRAVHEPDNITTLVEAVDIMTTPHASASNSVRSPEPGLRTSPRSPRTPRTPHGIRKRKDSPCKSPKTSPRQKKDLDEELKLALDAVNSYDNLPSVINVQCARKENSAVKTSSETSPRSGGKSNEKKESKEDKDVSSTDDVSSLLKQLCAGHSNSKLSRAQKERVSGSKNAQLLCINGGSPRPSYLGTPQLLRILEETIQKQAPKPKYPTKPPVKDLDRYRLSFNRGGASADALLQYRTKFVQHMLSSPMYANNRIGKPWEMIGKISEEIIDEILVSCAQEMQLKDIVEELYKSEIQ